MSFTDELKKKLEVSKEYLKEHPEMWQAYKLSVEMEDGIDNIQNVLVETDDNGKPVGFRVDFKVGVTKKEAEQDMARFCQGVGSKEGYKLERNLLIDRKVYVGFADVPEYTDVPEHKSQEQLFKEEHPEVEKFYVLRYDYDESDTDYRKCLLQRPTNEEVDKALDGFAQSMCHYHKMSMRMDLVEVNVTDTGLVETVLYTKEKTIN